MKSTNVWSDMMTSIGVRLNLTEEVFEHRGEQEMLSLIDEARREWLASKNYFDNVLDPDLIDHAVYVSQAAEKRYMYLLKQARNQGLIAHFPTHLSN
ncbi:MAG: hypothetical protein FD169_2024 [Bacillota bacterium]|nr:MAG: hypothetical protein FD169_2024 [Bacillota bacterium]